MPKKVKAKLKTSSKEFDILGELLLPYGRIYYEAEIFFQRKINIKLNYIKLDKIVANILYLTVLKNIRHG